MGSTGAKQIDISGYRLKVEKPNKRWDSRDQENLDWALTYMTREFGDFSDLINGVKKRSGNWEGLWDKEGFELKGERQLMFRSDRTITKKLATHELTHVVAEEIADNAKVFGFKDRDDFFNTIRSQAYKDANVEEPKYDGRRWAHRNSEFPSRILEDIPTHIERGQSLNAMQKSVLRQLKQYWKQYRDFERSGGKTARQRHEEYKKQWK